MNGLGLVWVALAPVFLTIVVLWFLDVIRPDAGSRFKHGRRTPDCLRDDSDSISSAPLPERPPARSNGDAT